MPLAIKPESFSVDTIAEPPPLCEASRLLTSKPLKRLTTKRALAIPAQESQTFDTLDGYELNMAEEKMQNIAIKA